MWLTLAASLILVSARPGPAAEPCPCVLQPVKRIVEYYRQLGTPVGELCSFTYSVVDHRDVVCPDYCASLPEEIKYPVTVLVPGGLYHPCHQYQPSYRVLCREGVTPASFGTTTPSDLMAYSASSTEVGLTWLNNSDRCVCLDVPPPPGEPLVIGEGCPTPPGGSVWQQFQVERRSSSTGFSVIAIIGPNAELIDPGVLAGQTYTYRVRGYDEFGPSPYTNEATVTVGSPAPPDGGVVQATVVSASRVDLGWVDGGSDEDGFEIERSTARAPFATLAAVGADVTAYSDTSVAASTTYVYRVRAFGSAGVSPWATSPSVVTPGPLLLPNAPCCLTASASQRNGPSVSLAWTDRSDNETGFRVERRLPGKPWAVIASAPKNATGLTDSAVAARTTYVYRVTAYIVGGGAASSEEKTVTTP